MPWIATVLAWLTSRVFTSVFAVGTFLLARRVALGTALIVVYSATFVALVASIKTAVMGARYVMPAILAQSTYFLPSNLPVILATIVTVRVSIVIYRWTITNMSVYASHGSGYGSLIH